MCIKERESEQIKIKWKHEIFLEVSNDWKNAIKLHVNKLKQWL